MSDLTIEPAAPTTTPGTTRTAKLVTEIFAPWVLILALFLALGARTGPTGLAWGLLAATFPSIGPMAVIVRGVLTNRYTDHHLTTRKQRLLPLLLSGLLVITGIAVLYLAQAPAPLLAAEVAMLCALLIFTPITAFWKISFHTGVAAAAATLLTLTYGPALSLLSPLVALIGWSRVRLAHHTTTQVIAGAPTGALITALPFLLIR